MIMELRELFGKQNKSRCIYRCQECERLDKCINEYNRSDKEEACPLCRWYYACKAQEKKMELCELFIRVSL